MQRPKFPSFLSSTVSRIGAVVGVVVLVAGVVFFVVNNSGDEDSAVPRGDADEVLAPTDPAGSPRFILDESFDPIENSSRSVPRELQTDSEAVLSVSSASFVDGDGPYLLRWNLQVGDEDIACINCHLLDTRMKQLIKSMIDADVLDGVDEIRGVDVARTLAGDYAGTGWQAEFVVGATARSIQDGERISTWLLTNSRDKKIFSVTWQNMFYSKNACDSDLISTSPVLAYPTDIGSDAQSRRDAAMDRVVATSPSYAPVFEDRQGVQVLAGWKATSC